MDDFSDDGFDELNFALLQELENKALQSLQPQIGGQPHGLLPSQRAVSTAVTAEVIQVDDDVDPSDVEVLRELARMPTQHAFASRLAAAAAPRPLQLPAYSQRSVADVPLPAASTGRAIYRGAPQPAPARSQTNVAAAAAIATGRPPISAAKPVPNNTSTASNAAPPDSGSIESLQARVQALEYDLQTARGRASVIHDKYEAALLRHEAEVSLIRKQKDEELAKQRQRAEAAVAAQQSAATELEFARQDLREELEKGKKGRRSDRDGNPTTPRKNNAGRSNWNVADGFDDIELLPSPSKGFGRRLKEAGGGGAVSAVERTPTKGKRRRPTTDSPTMPLETLTVDADGSSPSPEASAGPGEGSGAAETAGEGGSPLLFLQEVLSYRSHPDEPTTIELFSRYTFPSNRKQTLAFFMLQRIPTLEGAQGTTKLMLDFCQLVLGIWSQCRRENYSAPIRALVSLLSYILARDPPGLAPRILEPLLPLAQETIYMAAGISTSNPGGDVAKNTDFEVRQLACDIDAGAIMSLLRLAAFGCLSPSAEGQTQQPQQSQASYPDMPTSNQAWFWGLIKFEFVLLMLSSKQQPDAFLGMLMLLRTSALPETIGPITNDPEVDASVVAAVIIDRICHHMVEPPKWTAPCKYTEWDMRLCALGVLDCFSLSPFGKLSLAASGCALPRLVDVFFPAYGDLRDRDVLDEPLYPEAGLLALSESEMRNYGIGGFDLVQTLGPASVSTPASTLGKTLSASAASQTVGQVEPASASPKQSGDRNFVPLVMLYVSSVVCLVHSIVTDPFTAGVANIPSKLAETRNGTQSLYLLTLARLGFRTDPAFASGLDDETYKMALELFKLAAAPEEYEDYANWTQNSKDSLACGADSDPFADYVPEHPLSEDDMVA